MSVDSKHIATFLLGAAAAFAAHKYMNMTPEEKEKLSSTLKDKAHKYKSDAEGLSDKAQEYFSELKTKGGSALKDHFPDIENWLHSLFGDKGEAPNSGGSKEGPAL
ncbi:MAG: hypothetical protein H0W62_08240 [Chitinophagales bacterium]|nr:hypothetical protein [Chitinophagales bacterium]